MTEETSKPKIPTLTHGNYYEWYHAVGNELYAIDAELLFEKAAPTHTGAEQTGKVDATDVDEKTRKKAYIMILRSLSQEVEAKLRDVGRGEVETLLRRVRLSYFKPSPYMVEMLHDKISTMVVDNYPSMDSYTLEFKQTAAQMLNCGGKVDESLLRMWYLKGLPSDYAMVKFQATAANMSLADTYTAITAFAGTDPKLTGSTHPARKQARRERATTASEPASDTREQCKNYAKTGECKFGDKCRWKHVKKPNGGTSNTGTTDEDCAHCKKNGVRNLRPHATADCFRKDFKCDICKNKGRHSTSHCPTTRDKAAATNEVEGEFDSDDLSKFNVALTANDSALVTADTTTTDEPASFKLLIDGGANCAIFTSTAGMTNIRPASIDIKVGGGIVHCDQIGDFTGTLTPVNSPTPCRTITVKDGRICPAFGLNVVSESRFTNAGFAITKKGKRCTFSRGNTTFSATRSNDELFYFTITPATSALKVDANATTALSATDLGAATTDDFAFNSTTVLNCFVDSASAETCIQCGCIDHAYVARAYDTYGSPLILQHMRYGHRNLADVARLMGLTLPPKPIFCRTCVEGKSTRLSLSKRRVEPIYIAPRPAYAWHTDVAGPFSTRTPEGHNLMRLLVDGYSHLRKVEMVSSTADFHIAWENHITSVETDLGRTSIVAQLISDSARYYDSDSLDLLNTKKGIMHLFSPPNTQSLNHIAERSVRTMVEMARCMMIHCGAPKTRYGKALLYATYILNRLPWKSGEDECCLERYYQRTIANPRKHIRVFGCATWVHLSHPTGPHVDKLDAKASLHVCTGFDPLRRCYITEDPTGRTVLSAHCTFNESLFPWKSRRDYEGPTSSDFVDDDLLFARPSHTRLQVLVPDEGDPEPVTRLRRSMPPSAKVIANASLVAIDPSVDGDYAFLVRDSLSICAAIDAISSNEHKTALAAFKTPEALAWSKALTAEVESHYKEGTLGPALTSLPPGTIAIPIEAIFRTKRDGRHKARVIIKGFRMTAGLDYNETFAPQPNITSYRLLFAMAAEGDWEIKQGDEPTAFLKPLMDTIVHVKVGDWFFNPTPSFDPTKFTYHKLVKTIPGVPQGPRLYSKRNKRILEGECGMVQCPFDTALYAILEFKIFLPLWVDDFFLFFPTSSTKEAAALWAKFRLHFQLAEWEDVGDCLNCDVSRDRPNRTLSLTQEKYIRLLADKLKLPNAKSPATPMATDFKPTKTDSPDPPTASSDQTEYRSNVASLIYCTTWSLPIIQYNVSKLCKFMANPGEKHMAALKRLLRWVITNCPKQHLVYDFSKTPTKTGIYGYYDAAHADDPDSLRSTMGYVFFYSGAAISWHSKLHTFVTTSTNDSEYCAAAKAAKEAKWLHQLYCWMTGISTTIDLFSDSTGAIALCTNPVGRARHKHVDLADHYARELFEAGIITISFVPTDDMVADIFTKALPEAKFKKFTKIIMGR